MNILVVMNDLPFPTNSGGKIDCFYKLKALAESGHNIYLLASFSDNSDVSSCNDAMEKLGVRPFFYPRKKDIQSNLSLTPYYVLSSRMSQSEVESFLKFVSDIHFDVMVIDHLNSSYAAGQVKDRIYPGKIVYRAHNVEFNFLRKQLYTGHVSILRRIVLLFDTLKMFFYEPRRLKEYKHIASISKADIEYFSKKNHAAKVCWVPPFFNYNVSTTYEQLGREEKAVYDSLQQQLQEKKVLLFANNFTNGFNVDATQWFLGDVWPSIKAEIPNAHFIIAGRNAGFYFTDNDGISVVNGFDSVAPYMLITNIVLILTFGKEGVKLKLMEALSFNKRIVSTIEGVYGSGLEDLVLTASDSSLFSKLCQSYLVSDDGHTFAGEHLFFFDEQSKIESLL